MNLKYENDIMEIFCKRKIINLKVIADFFYLMLNSFEKVILNFNLFNFSQKHCKYEKAKLWLHYKPSLFQHIGMTSSLKGKVQKLKDRQFGKIPAFYPHKNNPLAQVRTQITAYKIHTLNKAYNGDSFFWGLLPQSGDYLEFIFNQPMVIKK